jgi:hypothetical protein
MAMTLTRYATPEQARADAEAVNVLQHTGKIEITALQAIDEIISNPHASSDTLLINADALRSVAKPWLGQAKGQALINLADQLAALAPSRASATSTGAGPVPAPGAAAGSGAVSCWITAARSAGCAEQWKSLRGRPGPSPGARRTRSAGTSRNAAIAARRPRAIARAAPSKSNHA